MYGLAERAAASCSERVPCFLLLEKEEERKGLVGLGSARLSRPNAIATDSANRERAAAEAAALAREGELNHGADAARIFLALADLKETRLGDAEGAIAALEAARRADPNSPAVLGALRRTALRLWRWPLAADALAAERKHRSGEELTARTMELAEVLSDRLGRGDEALALLAEVLESDPAHPRALGAAIPLWTARAAWSEQVGALEAAAEAVSIDGARAASLLYQAAEVCRWRLHAPERAVVLYERALDAAPAAAGESAKGLAEVASELRDWPRLARALEREASITSSPELAAASLVKLGQLREDMLDDLVGAETAFRAALEKVPTNRSALNALSRVAEAKGDHALRAELLERRLLLCTDVREAIAISLSLGSLYEESLGSKDRAANHFRRVLAVTADEAPAFRALGRLLASTADWRGLADLYEREAKETPDPLHRVHCLFKIAELHEEKLGDDEAAIVAYRRVLETSPTYLPALRALGRLFARRQDWEALVGLYENEASATEDAGHAIGLLARTAELLEDKIGDPGRAVAAWRGILERSPDHLPALRALGRLHHRRGAWEDLVAVNLREAALTRDPRVVAALLHKTGEVYEDRLTQPEDALRCYREALEHVPNYLPSMRSLGRLAASRGAWEEVIKTEEMEAEGTADPRRAASLLSSAAEHYETRLGDATRAIKAYERVLERVPTYLPALAGLARLYRREKRWEDLVRILDAAIPAMNRDPGAAVALLAQIAGIEGHQLGRDADAERRLARAREGARNDLGVRREHEEYLAKNGSWTDLASAYASTAEAEVPGPMRAALYVRLGDLARKLGAGGPGEGTASAAGFYRAALGVDPASRAAAAALDALGRETGDERMRIEGASAAAVAASTLPERRAILAELAGLQERAGDLAAAEGCWAAVVQIAPDAESWEALAGVAMRAGRAVAAAEALEKAIAAASDPADRERLTLSAANAFAGARQWERAEALLAPALPNAGPSLLLALERILEDRVAGMAADGPEARTTSERLADVRKRLAAASLDPRRKTEISMRVATALSGTPGRGAEATALLEAVVASEPSGSAPQVDALRRLAELYGAQGDAVREATALERIAESVKGTERAQLLVRAGEVLRAVDADRAILCWERAVAADVGAPGALQGLIELYRAREAWQPLLATWNRVIQATRDPKVAADAFYQKALILSERLNLHDKAEEHYKRALGADPNFIPALDRMVGVHRAAGRAAEARAALAALIARGPEGAPETLERQVRLARLEREGGDDVSALERLHAVMAGAPERIDVHEEILSILEARPEGPPLIAALRNAVMTAAEPRKSELRRRLARALDTRFDDSTGALAEYRALVRVDPNDLDARAAIAAILSRKKETRADAILAHAALLKIDPLRVDSLSWLASVYEETKQHDKVLCVSGVLEHLGKATQEQKIFHADQIQRAPRAGSPGLKTIALEDRRALLFHPEARSNTADLLTKAGPYLWAGVVAEAGPPSARLGAGDRHPLRLRLDALRALFGAGDAAVDLVIAKAGGAEVTLIAGETPVIRAGPGVAELSPAAQDFLLARAVFRVVTGWGPSRSAADVRADLWLAAAALDVHAPASSRPEEPSHGNRTADPKRVRAVAKAIPRRLRKELGDPLAAFVARPQSFDVDGFVRGAERSADRAGVLAAIDAARILEAMGEPKAGLGVPPSPAAKEALWFVTSDEHFLLRKKTGLTIFAG